MKKTTSRIVSVLLVLLMLVTAVPAAAAAEALGFTGTQGKKEEFQFYQNYEDIITTATITQGSVPGMELTTVNNASAAITGTPSQAGSFTLEVTLEIENGGTLEYALTIDIAAPAVSTLKVTKNPTDEEVAEGASATFIARADGAKQFEWEFTDANGSVMLCKDLQNTYPDVEVSGYNKEKLVLDNIPMEFDGCKVRCKFIADGESLYGGYATIQVKAAADMPPTVTKHPTSEIVTEGGRAVFIAKADNVETYLWKLCDEEGTEFTWEEALLQLKDLEVTGETTERIVLTQIPASMDGFTLRCVFTGPGGETTSKAATLEVTASEDAKPEITKHPTGETVEEGEAAVFIAKAKYAKSFLWQLVSPDGTQTLDASNPGSEFDGLKIGGYDTERLTLENIPATFDGWKVQCKFVGGGGSVISNAAVVKVNPDPNKAETTEETEETTEEPTEEATGETEEATETTSEETTEPLTTKPAVKDTVGGVKNTVMIILIILAAAVLGAGIAAAVVLIRQGGQRDEDDEEDW